MPGDSAAPVMADHVRLLVAEGSDQGSHVCRYFVDSVVAYTLGTLAPVEPAHIERDHMKSLGQPGHDAAPLIPALRETVQEHNERRAGLHYLCVVQFQAVYDLISMSPRPGIGRSLGPRCHSLVGRCVGHPPGCKESSSDTRYADRKPA